MIRRATIGALLALLTFDLPAADAGRGARTPGAGHGAAKRRAPGTKPGMTSRNRRTPSRRSAQRTRLTGGKEAKAGEPRRRPGVLYDPVSRMVRTARFRETSKEPWRRLPLGATYLGEGKTSFVVWAPRARAVEVTVLGPKGEASRRPLLRGKDGYFHGVLEGIEPGTRYKYALRARDGAEIGSYPDPASRFQPEGVHGPSEVVDLSLPWSASEATFEPPPLRDYLIYQFHVGTFTRSGDLDGAAAHMGEVAKTGFTAAQPLPVHQFPGARNWGYDPAQIYAVQDSYGGPEGLKTWVESTHRAGMAAVLDVVYNHPGPEGNYLGAFGPYFEGTTTPWGRGILEAGAARPHVWRYFIENALYWAATYRIDGLRIDASHALPRRFLAELKRATENLSEKLGRRIVIIAEDNQNDGRIVERGRESGRHRRGADAQWSTDPWHAWRVLHTGDRGSYLEDFATAPLELLARGLRRGWIYEGQVSPHTGEPRGTPAGDLPANSHVLPLGDHDQYGNTPTGSRLSSRVSARVQRSTDLLRYVLPVIPQVFMGDEWGTEKPFLYFVDHGDPAVREATRAGREAEFRDFFRRSGTAAPDPAAADTHRRSVLDHREKKEPRHLRRLALHRELIRLRKSHPALSRMGKRSMQVSFYPRENVLAIRRWAPGGEILALYNVGDKPAKVDLRGGEIVPLRDGETEPRRPLTGRWIPLIESEDRRFGGEGGSSAPLSGSRPVVHLEPHASVYFEKE